MDEDEMALNVRYPDLEALIEAEVAQPLAEDLLDPGWLVLPEIEPSWMDLPEIDPSWLQLPEIDREWALAIIQEPIQELDRNNAQEWEH